MTLKEAFIITLKQLESRYPLEVAPSIAGWILSWITGASQSFLITHGNQPFSDEAQKSLQKVLQEHIELHKPLPYIFGTVPFLSLELTLRPPILIPRSETEYWCGWLIDTLKKEGAPALTILDMCTGSGCIGISLAHAFPQSTVYGVDKASYACDLAQENAQKYGLSSFHCIQSDLYKELPPTLRFDLIVSNPPYIALEEWATLDPSVKEWEDPQALHAKQEGLFLIRQIIEQAPRWLSPRFSGLPNLVIECGFSQGPAVKALCEEAGFSSVVIHKDLSGKDRFITAQYKKRGS